MSDEQNKNIQPNQGSPTTPYYFAQPVPAYYPYYQARQFPLPHQQQQQQYQQTPQSQQPQQQQQTSDIPGMLPLQQSFIENILRLNRGEEVTVYMTFENNEQRVFRGVIEAAGRDHLILSEPQTGKRYLLLMVYLDYVEFDNEINYQFPGLGSFPSR